MGLPRLLQRLIAATLLLMPLHGHSAAPSPCSQPAFRAFDFWIGEWRVHDAKGAFAGTNSITSEQDGCVLIERWHSKSGRTGMSMNYYDPKLQTWNQVWVGLGIQLQMSGKVTDGSIVMEGPLLYLDDGRSTRLRGTWTPLADGRVRQHFVESADNGATWQEWFDGYYTRAK